MSNGNFQLAGDSAKWDYSDMENSLRKIVANRLKELNLGPIEAATAGGLERNYIRDIVEGKKKSLRTDKVAALARALQLEPSDLNASMASSDIFDVPVVGYVGAGAAAHFYGNSQGEIDRVTAPEGATKATVAVEIRGESLGPLYDGWLVYYDEVHSPVTPNMVGKLCVVGLPDDRILIKQIKRSRVPGFYHLLSNNEAPILDVEIDWAAKVKSMVPRD